MMHSITRFAPNGPRIKRIVIPFVCGMLFAGAFSLPTLTSADSSENEEIYRQLGLFGDIFQRVRESYVDEVDEKALIEAAESHCGGVDLLVNNAGLGGSKRVVDMSDEEWHKVLDVTLTGTFRMTRAMLKRMQPRGAGAIVNNASVLGWRAQVEQALDFTPGGGLLLSVSDAANLVINTGELGAASTFRLRLTAARHYSFEARGSRCQPDFELQVAGRLRQGGRLRHHRLLGG